MKYIKILPAILMSFIFLISCKKENDLPAEGVTALNIVNAIPGTSGLVANVNNQLLNYKNGSPFYGFIGYGAAFPLSFQGGNTNLSVRDISDTTKSVYENGSLELPDNTVHTLFLTGSITAPESVLTTDTIPYYAVSGHSSADSVLGIRFINLSSGNAVTVNLQGSQNGADVSNLAYKEITNFRTYAAGGDAFLNGYTFEFRDATTGDVLATYSSANFYFPAVPVFKNITIVLYGEPGSQATMSVNSF